jgi:hypothetical protein
MVIYVTPSTSQALPAIQTTLVSVSGGQQGSPTTAAVNPSDRVTVTVTATVTTTERIAG